MDYSAGTEQLPTNEWGGTVQAAQYATQQLQDRASAQSACEWRNHKLIGFEVCFL
jgi:hypothetical protein